MSWRESALFQAPAPELTRTEVGLAADEIEIDVAMRRRYGLDGALHRVQGPIGYPAEARYERLSEFDAGLPVGKTRLEFACLTSEQIFEANGPVRQFGRRRAQKDSSQPRMEAHASRKRSRRQIEALFHGHCADGAQAHLPRVNDIEAAVGHDGVTRKGHGGFDTPGAFHPAFEDGRDGSFNVRTWRGRFDTGSVSESHVSRPSG